MKKVILKWHVIEKLGNSRISRNSYYWFFLIPILGKLFQNIPEEIFIEGFTAEPIQINLTFPFSWYILFAVGILFILSNIIYRISCPHIVREFMNFSEFIASGYPNSYLLVQKDFHDVPESDTLLFQKNLPERQKSMHKERSMTDYEIEHNFRKAQKEYFDKIYNIANKSNLKARILATFVIVLAIILMGIIIVQNIITVFDIYYSK